MSPIELAQNHALLKVLFCTDDVYGALERWNATRIRFQGGLKRFIRRRRKLTESLKYFSERVRRVWGDWEPKFTILESLMRYKAAESRIESIFGISLSTCSTEPEKGANLWFQPKLRNTYPIEGILSSGAILGSCLIPSASKLSPLSVHGYTDVQRWSSLSENFRKVGIEALEQLRDCYPENGTPNNMGMWCFDGTRKSIRSKEHAEQSNIKTTSFAAF